MHKITLFESTLNTILEKVDEETEEEKKKRKARENRERSAKLNQSNEIKYKAAVAIVQCKNKWLLGLSTATDQRKSTWCFPGGGIKNGEQPTKAAVRECFEETGIRCEAVGKAFAYGSKQHVAFVHCKTTKINQKFVCNEEFAGMGWFTKQQMKTLRLFHNVLRLIDRVT